MQTVGKNMTAGRPLKHILALSLPLLIVFPFVEKYFVKGVMIGSVKG